MPPDSACLRMFLRISSVKFAFGLNVSGLCSMRMAPLGHMVTQRKHAKHFESSARMQSNSLLYVSAPKPHSTVHFLHRAHFFSLMLTLNSGGTVDGSTFVVIPHPPPVIRSRACPPWAPIPYPGRAR